MKVIRSTRLIVLCLWVCSSLKGGIHAQVASGPTAAGGGGDLRPPRQQSSTSDFVYVASAGSWSTAEAGCVERGGHLASITSAAENQKVQELCSGRRPNAQLASGAGCWIGLSDQGTEGEYQWTDQTAYNYTAWHKGPVQPQPDADPPTRDEEDCVLFVVAPGYVGWHDWGCLDTHPYICKVPASPSPMTSDSSGPGVTDSPPTPGTPAPGSSDGTEHTAATPPNTPPDTPQSAPNGTSSSIVVQQPGPVIVQTAASSTDTRDLIIKTVVPSLTGLAALITIAYTGWKWWHKKSLVQQKLANKPAVDAASTVKEGGAKDVASAADPDPEQGVATK